MPQTTLSLPDGAELALHSDGRGPAILLISGLGGTAGFWAPLVPRLAERHQVVRFDQRGIGASTRGTAPCTIAQLAADALAVLASLGLAQAIVLGHSTGGCIAQHMAAAAPERVSGLVLSGTWLQPSRFMRELFRSRAALLHASPEEYAAQAVFTSYPPEWLDAHWDVLERAIQAAPTTPAARAVIAERIEALLAFDGSAPAARIAAPTLVLGAADDLIVPAFLQRELASALPGSRLHLFPDGGHFFPVSRADLYLDQLTRWIDAAR